MRELANLVERLSILSGPTVDAAAVRQVLRGGPRSARPRARLPGRPLVGRAGRLRARPHRRRARPGRGQHGRGRAHAPDRSRQSLPPHAAAGTRERPSSDRHSHFPSIRMRLLVGGLLLLLAARRWRGPRTASSSSTPTRHPAIRRRAGRPAAGRRGGAASRFYNDSHDHADGGGRELPARAARFVGPAGASIGGRSGSPGGCEATSPSVNGTLYLLPGAEVDGDILVVGGRLIRSPGARHAGRERVYLGRRAGRPHRGRDRSCSGSGAGALGDLATARTSFQTGKVRTTLLLATGGTYNRIEGLPIVFGPHVRASPVQATALRLDLRGHPADGRRGLAAQQRLRLRLRAEFRFGRWSASRVGCTARSRRSRISRCPRRRTAGRRFCCSGTTATSSNDGVAAARCGCNRPFRSGWSCRSGATTSDRCGPRTLVSVPEQRPVAAQSAHRRRPLPHHRLPGRFRYAERSGSADGRVVSPRPVRALDQRRRRAGHAARDREASYSARRRVRFRPAVV